MSDAISAVRQFFDGLDTTELKDAAAFLVDHVTEDFVWENSGLPPVKGPQGAAEFLLSFGQAMPMAGIRVEMRAIAAAGSTVVTERVDYMVDANGTTLLEIAMAGTLEVAPDGRISAWRDYFDPRPFLA